MDLKKKIAISIVVAVISFVGIFLYIQMRENELLFQSEMQQVLIAKKDIPLYTQIDETYVDITEVPLKYKQPDAINNLQDAIGQITSSPIKVNEQILGTKILRFGPETGASLKIPSGMRAATIAVDDVAGVAKLVQPDDFIDLIVTFDFGDQAQSRKYTYTLFENVQVLAVDQNLGNTFSALSQKNQESSGGLLDKLKGGSKSSTSVSYTLILTPEDAQRLTLAQETGRLTVSLRSLWDSDNMIGLKPITPADLTGIKALLKQNEGPSYMEFRGGKR